MHVSGFLLRRALAFAVVSGALLVTAPIATARATHHRHRHNRLHRAHRRHPRPARQAGTPSYCPNADVPATAAPAQAMRDAVVCLVNQQRGGRHLPMLQGSGLLNRSAQNWTDWMVATGNFTHGADFAGRISAVGFNWQAAGENIATGYATPRQVVNGWMASTGHCQNILNPTYREVGTGVNPDSVGAFASGPATWTQDFALGMFESPPSGNWAPANGCPY
jgi:uncharacterized protein YkwD